MKNTSSNPLTLIAGWCAYISGGVALVGMVFLLLMFIGFAINDMRLQRFGTLNDICIIIQYFLALPIILALHQHLKAHGRNLSRIGMLIGTAGIIAVIILQWLLVTGILTFEEQVGLVMIGLLLIGIWLGITAYLGRDMPRSVLLSVLAAFYLGYPVWAFWIGRYFLSSTSSPAVQSPSIQGKTA